MKLFSLILLTILLSPLLRVKAQTTEISWAEIQQGLYICEVPAPDTSIIDNSMITLVKIVPEYFEFEFLTATEFGKTARTAIEWSEEFNYEIILNAGMYSPNRNQTNKGYLKNRNHINNPKIHPYYNAMMAIHPKKDGLHNLKINDLTCTPWTTLKSEYNSFCQGMRMIDCNGEPMSWDKNPNQKCSMIVAANDTIGNFYIFFTRSPYTHQKFIQYLLGFQLHLRETIYLEGGPEASLLIKSPDKTIERFGTYVSKTWERSDNATFWKLPNVLAIRPKKDTKH